VQGLKKREKAFPGAGEWMGGGKDSVRVGGLGGDGVRKQRFREGGLFVLQHRHVDILIAMR